MKNGGVALEQTYSAQQSIVDNFSSEEAVYTGVLKA